MQLVNARLVVMLLAGRACLIGGPGTARSRRTAAPACSRLQPPRCPPRLARPHLAAAAVGAAGLAAAAHVCEGARPAAEPRGHAGTQNQYKTAAHV